VASSLLGTGAFEFLSSSRSAGEMVRKSTPARALISPVCGQKSQTRVLQTDITKTYVTERGTHDDGLVTVLLVIAEDLLDGLDTRVFVTLVVLSRALLIPIEDLNVPRSLKTVRIDI
jgi:hypothetical protein